MPPPDPEDDAALIERSWHDPEAFAGLYDRHAAPLHRYAARRLGVGAADDIVADTFLDAFRKRRRYDLSVSDARPWLYGIAANLIGNPSEVFWGMNGVPIISPRTPALKKKRLPI